MPEVFNESIFWGINIAWFTNVHLNIGLDWGEKIYSLPLFDFKENTNEKIVYRG